MKLFLKLWFVAIPFAIGMVFSLLSVTAAVAMLQEGLGDTDATALALLWGLIGFPLLVASTFSIANVLDRRTTVHDASKSGVET